MDKKSKDRFEITELFMAMAGKDRCFTGIIKRLKDIEGNPFVFSRIVMPDGLLCAQETDQKALGENLDKMCVMIKIYMAILENQLKSLALTSF
jgi:hypothetical protein